MYKVLFCRPCRVSEDLAIQPDSSVLVDMGIIISAMDMSGGLDKGLIPFMT